MPRQTLTPKTPLGSYPSLPLAALAADFAFAAADAANKEQFVASGNDLIIAFNSSVGTPRTITITSVADEKSRIGDIATYTVGVGLYSVFGPFKSLGWRQSDGNFFIEASHAELKWAIIRLP